MPALIATAVATNEIHLAWTDYSDSEEGFNRTLIDGIDFVLLGLSVQRDGGRISTRFLPPHWYRVTAPTRPGSRPPPTRAATTPRPFLPTAPRPRRHELSITAATSNSVTLAWTARAMTATPAPASYDLR
jgi:hypothetical protein